ncbi:MAG: N-6 DNA methylase, partial [Bacteroidales bacterium]|nr:N-6 DNA methylase [Bacteroidales bacterium]
MSLFQKSVEKKYLNELDSVLIDKKYKEFQSYFGNPSIQENIRNSKEEQFQEGFLRELFVSIFGYTLNPQPNFNLTTELKNIANSKKADGAILKGEDAFAVIELKGTDTTDLDRIETQAFGYKNHHPKCVYVITSNFEKLRFYIQNAVDHIDFDLFNLTREQFSLMWLCLAKDNLLNGLPQKIKESSLLQEENITKKLYADYSKFREAIYNNLVKNNPETDKLLLFKKTQKLLDRFLFIFFAEDRLLLPPNSISEIVKQWTTLKEELDEYVPLYDRFKKYFGYMNTGYKGKKYDIYAYNGGLFAPDEILDNISIDDEILHKHTLTISNYDFETDVDVNILGHIFEHSLGEIENVQAEIKGEKIDSQKTRRKKDGIFYTPKYITKYIVENTIGKLCEEKRTELDIVDEEYSKGRKNRKKDTIKTLEDKLIEYRNWLLSLTILDPACGSGAFLNQALDFLITEHRKIDDLRAQLFGSGLVFSDITTDILEKNIYGVDLNEESVEIAKLSLWLRTAQKGRKLNKLNNNIKCGNSLIDDPEVAGEKAFNWQNEFPEIFANGGFDVVIGNPPYGAKLEKADKDFLKKNYRITEYNYDTYNFFFELSLKILKENSFLGFITPNTFLVVENGV